MQQPAGVFPAGFGVDHAGWAAPSDGRELQAGQLVLASPADEVPCVGAVGGLRAGQPGLQVALPGGGQGQVAGGQPVQQRGSGVDVPLGGGDLVGGGVRAAEPGAQPAGHVPDGVAVQQLLLAGVGTLGDDPGGPAFQPGHLLVPYWQRPGGDQDGPQVLDCLAGGKLVEGAVSEVLAGQLTDDRRGRALAEPGGRGGWPVRAGEGVVEGLQLRAELPVLVAEQVAQPLLRRAAGAWAGAGCGRAARSPGSCARSRGQGGCRPSRAARWGCRRGSARSDRSARTGSSASCRPGTMACRWLWRSGKGRRSRRSRRSGSSTARRSRTAARREAGRGPAGAGRSRRRSPGWPDR